MHRLHGLLWILSSITRRIPNVKYRDFAQKAKWDIPFSCSQHENMMTC